MTILKHGEQGCPGCELLEGMLERSERNLDATEATCKALRNGEEPPHYCAWCMKTIKRGGDPDHMLACEKAPFQILTGHLATALALFKRDDWWCQDYKLCVEEFLAEVEANDVAHQD